MLTIAPLGAQARQFVCSPIARGETATGLALRLTGSAEAAYGARFEIRDPARGVFVPKSRYDRLSTNWQVCVAREVLKSALVPRAGSDPSPSSARYNASLAIRVGLTVSLALFACSVAARYLPARPIPPDLQRAGEDFIRAFAQPLIDPSSDVPPIAARLRFVRQADQLEICIAPGAGRRYPNLLDHKKNVEYDVHRVVQRLGIHVIVSDCLRAEGKWVVVPIRRV